MQAAEVANGVKRKVCDSEKEKEGIQRGRAAMAQGDPNLYARGQTDKAAGAERWFIWS